MVATEVLLLVQVTVSPEEAVAPGLKSGSPYSLSARTVNVIVCAALLTVRVRMYLAGA